MPPPSASILLVEDNPLLVGLYKAAFAKRGLAVKSASDGKTGLEMVKTDKPRLILLDIYMPGMDGLAVLEAIKKSRALKATKVIVLTVVDRKETREKASQLGAVDYLIKPELKLEEIVERTLRHLSEN